MARTPDFSSLKGFAAGLVAASQPSRKRDDIDPDSDRQPSDLPQSTDAVATDALAFAALMSDDRTPSPTFYATEDGFTDKAPEGFFEHGQAKANANWQSNRHLNAATK